MVPAIAFCSCYVFLMSVLGLTEAVSNPGFQVVLTNVGLEYAREVI